ncbi:Protein of unknown function [Bacillus cereus]|nr:Protein of unknown function [Bacillus cereus]
MKWFGRDGEIVP